MALASMGNLVTGTYRLTGLEVGKHSGIPYILVAQGHCLLEELLCQVSTPRNREINCRENPH